MEGKDTTASFGDGTIQIQRTGALGTHQLTDLAHNHKILLHNVQSYEKSESESTAFVYGDGGTYVIVNVDTNVCQVYDSIDDVPDTLQGVFRKLEKRNDSSNSQKWTILVQPTMHMTRMTA